MRGAVRLLLLCMLLSAEVAEGHVRPIDTQAHEAGLIYTDIAPYRSGLAVLYTVPVADLRNFYGDTPNAEQLAGEVAAGFLVFDGARPCRLVDVQASNYRTIGSFQYYLHYRCSRTARLSVDYRLFSGYDHKVQVDVWLGEGYQSMVLNDRHRAFDLPIARWVWESGWSLPAEVAQPWGPQVRLVDYLFLGFDHVLSGLDHLFFVLGLVLLVPRFVPLIGLITSFTIAHSITLGIAALDIYVMPRASTELLIGVSIAYIGLENLWGLYRGTATRDGGLGKAALQRRWFGSFVFGLIHGFGFSFILREVGLPPESLVQSLALFNAGVEAAQIVAVVIPFIILQRLLRGTRAFNVVAALLSLLVTFSGLWWIYDRSY